MKKANIKIPSSTIEELKRLSGSATGHSAVEKAIVYFLKEARQRDMIKFLSAARFKPEYDPISLRHR